MTGNETQHQNHLEYNKLVFFYSSLPYIILGQTLGTLLISSLVYGAVENYSLGIWLLLNILVILYQLYHFYIFRTANETDKVKHSSIWLDRYYTDVLAYGIIWGSSAFLIFPSSNLMDQAIVLLFLVVVGFTSMGILASKKELLLTYALVMFTPIILRLFFLEGEIYRTLAYSGLGLMLIMIIVADYYGKVINASLASQQSYLDTNNLFQKIKGNFFALLEHAPIGMFMFDKNMKIKDANARLAEILNLKDRKDLIGHNIDDAWSNHDVVEHHKKALMGHEGESRDLITIHLPQNGGTKHIRLSSFLVKNSAQEVVGGISMVSDLTQQLQVKSELERLRHHDFLTDLPNKTFLLKELKSTINDKLRSDTYGALLYLDIDHFNNINRLYGQNTGDKVLQKISSLFKKLIDNRGVVARIGSDTFVFMIPELYKERTESKRELLAFVSELKNAFESLIVLGDTNYFISFTAGATLFNDNHLTPHELLKYAESALFEAKDKSRGTVQFYEEDRHGSAIYDLTIANDIHKAIRNNELSIRYQPQQDIQHGTLVGAEALVRWTHPQKGDISPAHFIPIAEEYGAIIELEDWIFERIFRDIHKMSEALNEFPLNYIAVNVSSTHFLQPSFVEKFTQLAHSHQIDPAWINIEITESGIMKSIDEAAAKIQELKRLGFGFSMDDFGTGYSSLAYLKNLPVDIIKIDRSFVKDADRNKGDRLIVESVIEICQKFGFKVLAEGIDRQETLDYFKTTSCKTFQGYLYYKPLNMEEFIQII